MAGWRWRGETTAVMREHGGGGGGGARAGVPMGRKKKKSALPPPKRRPNRTCLRVQRPHHLVPPVPGPLGIAAHHNQGGPAQGGRPARLGEAGGRRRGASAGRRGRAVGARGGPAAGPLVGGAPARGGTAAGAAPSRRDGGHRWSWAATAASERVRCWQQRRRRRRVRRPRARQQGTGVPAARRGRAGAATHVRGCARLGTRSHEAARRRVRRRGVPAWSGERERKMSRDACWPRPQRSRFTFLFSFLVSGTRPRPPAHPHNRWCAE